MDYYRTAKIDLHHELTRRGYRAYGDQDEAAERLKRDDEQRGTIASTVDTISGMTDAVYTWKVSPEFGKTVMASMLVNECIVHWTMNTFFPTLHLFFASGRSCTIEESHLPGAFIGLDPALRFRLTDITHEENGSLTKTIISQRPAAPATSIRILESTVAYRRSIAVKETHQILSARPVTTIAQEQHIVVGLRLEGMECMSYVWAKLPRATVEVAGRMWGHVRIAGLKDDVPVPFMRFPQTGVKPGAKVTVVLKKSMVDPKLKGRPII